jgi:hypothetical protein
MIIHDGDSRQLKSFDQFESLLTGYPARNVNRTSNRSRTPTPDSISRTPKSTYLPRSILIASGCVYRCKLIPGQAFPGGAQTLPANMDIRDVAPKSKNLEQPDNNGNDLEAIEENPPNNKEALESGSGVRLRTSMPTRTSSLTTATATGMMRRFRQPSSSRP